MIIQESISTALDSIRANLLRSLLTTIAIVIGTASVIAMVGIGSSAQKAIDDSITNVSARTITVSYMLPSWPLEDQYAALAGIQFFLALTGPAQHLRNSQPRR